MPVLMIKQSPEFLLLDQIEAEVTRLIAELREELQQRIDEQDERFDQE